MILKIIAVIIIFLSPALAQDYETRTAAVIIPDGYYCKIGTGYQDPIGEGVYYLPPNTPQVKPGLSLIKQVCLTVEGGWPANRIDNASPVFMAVDRGSEWERCSHYPGLQDCPAANSYVSQFYSLNTVALLDDKTRQTKICEKHPEGVPYRPGDALIFVRPCNVAAEAEITAATVSGTTLTVTGIASGSLASSQIVQHDPQTSLAGVIPQGAMITSQISGTPGGVGVYSLNTSSPALTIPSGNPLLPGRIYAAKTALVSTFAKIDIAMPSRDGSSACSTNTKLLIHPTIYRDSNDAADLSTFIGDSSHSWNALGSVNVTVDKTTAMSLPEAFPNRSLRFNGNSAVWANASNAQMIGDKNARFRVFLRPDDTATAYRVIYKLAEGYSGIELAQYGNKLTIASSSNGTSWNVIDWTQIGTLVAGQTTHVTVQKVGGTLKVSQDGVDIFTGSLSGPIVTAKNLRMMIGASTTAGANGFKGNASEIQFEHNSDGSNAVPTAPYPCP